MGERAADGVVDARPVPAGGAARLELARRGRLHALGERDRAGAPRAAVVSESMARRYFGGVNAVGRRFRPDLSQDGWMQIVGVARDTAKADLNDELVGQPRYTFYRSIEQWGVPPNVVVARSTLGGAALVRSMQAVNHVDVGYRMAGLLSTHIEIPTWKVADDGEALRLRQELLRRVATVSGVHGVRVEARGLTRSGLPFVRERERSAVVWRGADSEVGSEMGDVQELLLSGEPASAELERELVARGVPAEHVRKLTHRVVQES